MIILKTIRLSVKKKIWRRLALFPDILDFRVSSGKKALIAVALVIPLLFVVILIFSKYETG